MFAGRLAVDGQSTALDRAELVCPTAVDEDYAANTQRGEGRCVITTGSGERLCPVDLSGRAGQGKGCARRSVLTGGAGAYQGVTGEGDFVLQLILADLIRFERLEAEYDLTGRAARPKLILRTP